MNKYNNSGHIEDSYRYIAMGKKTKRDISIEKIGGILGGIMAFLLLLGMILFA